jgi:hypothetical protein
MSPTNLTAHETYVYKIRADYGRCTPYRLGREIGLAGDKLPSPYAPGSRGDHMYLDGLEYGRVERKINKKACELYHASSANDPDPPWWELTGLQKWPWREKAIDALAASDRTPGIEGGKGRRNG